MNRILVGAPIHSSKDYATENYVSSLMSLTYPDMDIYLSDNSDDKNYHRNIRRKYGIDCGWIEPYKLSVWQRMCMSMNQIRTRVLYGGYEWYLSLEIDITPPRNVIEQLLAHKKEVVSIPYFVGKYAQSLLCQMDFTEEEEFPLSRLVSWEESFLNFDGQLKQVDWCGLGCTLIHRSVLELIHFWVREDRNLPPDTWFAHDLKYWDIPVYADYSQIVKHDNRLWKTLN